MQEKITARYRYWNDVHQAWFPVPPQWVGLYIWEVSHLVEKN